MLDVELNMEMKILLMRNDKSHNENSKTKIKKN